MRKNQNSNCTRVRQAFLLGAMFSLLAFMTACVNAKAILMESPNETSWMDPDSVIKKQIGDSVYHVLFMPDTVKSYHLSYKERVMEKDTEAEKNYVRDSLISLLSPSQVSVIQYVLFSDSANYSNDSILVQSPYLPTLEFEFTKKGYNTVSIVISTLDRSWKMMGFGKEIHAYNIADERQVERFCNYFMNIYERKEDKK